MDCEQASAFAFVAPFLPPLEQLDALAKLIGRGLIDTAPGARDQFGIQPAMVDAASSRNGADKQAMELAQVQLLLME